jgi:Tol biopolymer transport system component
MIAVSFRSLRRLCGAAFVLATVACNGSDLVAPSTGGLQVTAATSGNPVDLDQDGYTAALDGGVGVAVPVNGSVAFSELTAGTHSVALGGVAPNCIVSGQNPAEVTVTVGATAHSDFQITCSATTGSVQVTTATSGNPADLDQDGYTVALDGGAGEAVAVNGSATFSDLAAGTHSVTLDRVAANCTVSGENPAQVTVIVGTMAQLDFQITCTPGLGLTGRIAFVSDRDGNREIYTMNANGTGVTRLTNNVVNDAQPAWTSDGAKIAFVSDRDGNDEIYAMNADGSDIVRLTNDPAFDGTPAWSPDGTRIAFESTRDGSPGIYVMNADGSGAARLAGNTVVDARPAWAPDGTKIAFVSRVRLIGRAFAPAIYVVTADGSRVTLLSILAGPAQRLAWSPDGTKIAADRTLGGDLDIFVVHVDGSGNTTITNNPATDAQPSWSADGTKIAFASDRDGNFEIYVMNADGSDPTRLTNHPARDVEPAWAP